MNSNHHHRETTILIVDDQPTNIKILSHVLKEDYHILVATNGLKALELAQGKNPPDLILLDIEMPKMNGYEVCRQLKALDQTKNIPIIFVTARDKAEDEEKGFQIGAVDYISKPFHPVVVQARVRNQAQRKRAEEALVQSRERYEKISSISSYFISLPAEEIHKGVEYALQIVGEFLQVDRSYVFQFSDQRKTITNTFEWCAEGIFPRKKIIQDYPVAYLPWWAEKIHTEDALFIHDVEDLPPEAHAEKREFLSQGIQSLLNIPIISNNALIGALGFDVVKKKHVFTDEQIMMLKVVAELISNAFARHLANKEIVSYTKDLEEQRKELEQVNSLLDEEINKARRVHENTLPKIKPELDGFELFDYNQPASRMGGDFYDYIEIKKNTLLFYISDITGHGLDAAMMSAFVKNTISTYVKMATIKDNRDLDQLMDFMYEHYTAEQYPEDYFIAILIGVIDLDQRLLYYNSAGMHISPIFVTAQGSIELPAGGMPISAAISRELFYYHHHRLNLSSPSLLFFSTDGLMEQKVGDTLYGNRFQRVLEETKSLPLFRIAEEINKDFSSVTGKRIGDDDITFILMKFTHSL